MDDAALSLQHELAVINFRFLRGELKAFGSDQDVVLQELERLQMRQVELSMKQVSLMREVNASQTSAINQDNDFLDIGRASAVIAEKEEKLSLLNDELQSLCGAMTEVFHSTHEGEESDTISRPRTATASEAAPSAMEDSE